LHDNDAPKQPNRRKALQAALGVGLSIPLIELAEAAKAPEKMRPQTGDFIVYRAGDNKNETIKAADVPEGDELILAIPKDPVSGIVRDKSRFNSLNIVRLDGAQITARTKPYTADNIVAYSTVCTHQGCDLTQWLSETQTFKCYCHYSQFKAIDLGEPIHGPAKRKLAILPLKIQDGVLVAAGKFVGKLGFKA